MNITPTIKILQDFVLSTVNQYNCQYIVINIGILFEQKAYGIKRQINKIIRLNEVPWR